MGGSQPTARDYFLGEIRRFLMPTEYAVNKLGSACDELRVRAGMSEESFVDAVRKYQYRYEIFNELGKETARWFSPGLVREFEEGHVFVGEAPLLSFNATVSCNDASHTGVLILFNRGLADLLNDAVKVMVSSINVGVIDGAHKRETPMDHDQSIDAMLRLLRSVKPGKRYVGPPERFLPRSDLHLALQGQVIFAVERHVIAHELAHIARDHLQYAGTSKVLLADRQVQIGIHTHSHARELEADSMAVVLAVMQVAMSFARRNNGCAQGELSNEELLELRSRVWGILGFHSILRLVHKAAFGSDTVESDSHPSSRARDENARALLADLSRVPFGFDLTRAFDLFDLYLEEVSDRLA